MAEIESIDGATERVARSLDESAADIRDGRVFPVSATQAKVRARLAALACEQAAGED